MGNPTLLRLFLLLLVLLGVPDTAQPQATTQNTAGGGGFALALEHRGAGVNAQLDAKAFDATPQITVEWWMLWACEDCYGDIVSVDERVMVSSTREHLIVRAGRNIWRSFEMDQLGVKPREWVHFSVELDQNAPSLQLRINGTAIPMPHAMKFTMEVLETEQSSEGGDGTYAVASGDWSYAVARGGYLPVDEVTPCVFPFQYRGRSFDSCLEFDNPEESPYIGSAQDGDEYVPVANLTLWCAVSERYGRFNDERKYNWGFCEAPWFSSASFYSRLGLLGSTIGQSDLTENQLRETRYSPKAEGSFNRTSLVRITTDEIQDPGAIQAKLKALSFSEEVAAFVTSAENTIITYSQMRQLSQSVPELSFIVLEPNEDRPELFVLTLFEDLTCAQIDRIAALELSRGKKLETDYRCISQSGVLRHGGLGAYRGALEALSMAPTRDQVQTICGSNTTNTTYLTNVTDDNASHTLGIPAHALDADLSTEWTIGPSSTAVLHYTYNQPVPLQEAFTHYVIVSGANQALTPVGWSVEVLALRVQPSGAELVEWVLIDKKSDFGWQDAHEAQWFEVPVSETVLEQVPTSSIAAVRFTFDPLEQGVHGSLSEVGLFKLEKNSELYEESFYRNGPVDSNSWFAQNDMLQRESVNTTVLAMSPSSPPEILDALKASDFSALFLSRDETAFSSTLPSKPVFQQNGEDLHVSLGATEDGEAAIGAIDEFRIWAGFRSSVQDAVYQHVDLAEIESTDASLELYWDFDLPGPEEFCEDVDESVEALLESQQCAVPLTWDSSVFSSSTFGPGGTLTKWSMNADLTPQLESSLRKIASRAPVVGARTVAYLANSQSITVDIFAEDSRFSNGYSFRISRNPKFGDTSALLKATNPDFSVPGPVNLGSVTYTPKQSGLNGACGDTFQVAITPKNGDRLQVEIAVYFTNPVLERLHMSALEDAVSPLYVGRLSQQTNLPMTSVLDGLPSTGNIFQGVVDITSSSCATPVQEGDVIASNWISFLGDRDDALPKNFSITYLENDLAVNATGVINILPKVDKYFVGATDLQQFTHGENISFALNISDPDEQAAEETRSQSVISYVTRPPLFAKLLQLGSEEDVAFVPEDPSTFQETSVYPSGLVRFSSQAANCDFCSVWGDSSCYGSPLCKSSVGVEYLAQSALGEPDGRRWKPTQSARGMEFLELELETPLFVRSVELEQMGLYSPIAKIMVATEYRDRPSEPCTQDSTGTFCTFETEWTTLWALGEETSMESDIALCKSSFAARFLRLEFDVSLKGVGNWQGLDAVKVFGSLKQEPGRVNDSAGRFLISAAHGVFGEDQFELTAQDCEGRLSEKAVVTVSIQDDGETWIEEEPILWVPRATIKVQEVQFDLAVVKNVLEAALIQAKRRVPTSAELTAFVEGTSFQETRRLTDEDSVVMLGLDEIIPMELVEAGTETLPVRVSATGALDGPVDFRVRSWLGLDCAVAPGYERCAQERILYPGACITRAELRKRSCSCFLDDVADDAALRNYIAGPACEYTMWNTCLGRGTPVSGGAGDVRCACFNQTLFGDQFCNKRSGPVKSAQALFEELNVTASLIQLELPDANITVVNDAQSGVVKIVAHRADPNAAINESGSSARLLQQVRNDSSAKLEENETGLVASQDLLVLSVEAEMDPRSTCNDHGQPTGTGECRCDGFYQPPDCFSKITCEFGEYVDIQPNPLFINGTSDPTEVARYVSECKICPVGHACKGGFIAPCENGTTFAHREGQERCNDRCDFQEYYMVLDTTQVNHIRCDICPPGSRCNGKVAELCSLGKFSPDEGFTQCISCNSISSVLYADQLGSVACSVCPENTIRVNSPGESLEECVCKEGFWNGQGSAPNVTGVPCVECPENGDCFGNTQNVPNSKPPYVNVMPYPMEGFWGDPSFPSEFFECDDDLCTGGAEFACAEGSMGPLCFLCEEGYYSLGTCKECPGGGGTPLDTAFVAFCWIGIIFAWVLLNVASNAVRALDMALLFTQVVMLVQGFGLTWPWPVNTLNTPFEITDFEIDFLSPQCSWKSWSYQHHYTFQIMLPLIYGAIELSLVAMARKYANYIIAQRELNTSRDDIGAEDNDDDVKSVGSSATELDTLAEMEESTFAKEAQFVKKFIDRISRMFDLPHSDEEFESFRDQHIGLYINFLLIVYPSQMVVTLEPFMCMTLADGTNVLQASPDIVCWESRHLFGLVIWSVIGVPVFILGIPLFLLYKLNQLERTDTKAERHNLQRYGFLYFDYKQHAFKWETLLLFRRFAFSALNVLLSNHPFIQATFGAVVIVFCLALQVLYKPFVSDRINLLDEVGLFTSFLYIFLGVIFTAYAQDEEVISADISSVLSWILLTVTIGTLFLAFWVSFLDTRDVIRVLLAEARLLRRLKMDDVALVRALRRSPRMRKMEDVVAVLGLVQLQFGRSGRLKSNRKLHSSGSAATLLEGESHGSTELSRTSVSGRFLGSEVSPKESSSSTQFLGVVKQTLGFKPTEEVKKPTIFSAIDTDGDGLVNKHDMQLFVSGHLHMNSENHLEQIDQLFRKYDLDESSLLDQHEFEKLIHENRDLEIHRGSLKDAFKSKYLIQWAEKSSTALETCLFFELDNLVGTKILSTESPLHSFRNNNTAKFFRILTNALPFLLDWLCVAENDDIIAFSRILQQLLDCYETIGKQGVLSKIFLPPSRAPLVYWLANRASEKERLVFRAVSASILKSTSQTTITGLYQTTNAKSIAREREHAATTIQCWYRVRMRKWDLILSRSFKRSRPSLTKSSRYHTSLENV